ncbi:MAG: histidine phosphatase family protein [Proteobacteria bacterium]|nr:histidine phosphatase family protein [Pseudomonadota bacterium]
MKIYMIRHCESEDDVLNCYGGCADFELTAHGGETARAHSEKLTDLGIQKIYASPYKRAKNVAKIFAEKIGVDVEIINDLREWNQYGVMCGVNKDLAKDIFGLLINSDEYKSYGYYKGKAFEGGEPVKSLDDRVKRAFDYIVGRGLDTVAIVTHSGVFRSAYKNILNQPEQIDDIADAGTMEIEYNNGVFTVAGLDGIKLK